MCAGISALAYENNIQLIFFKIRMFSWNLENIYLHFIRWKPNAVKQFTSHRRQSVAGKFRTLQSLQQPDPQKQSSVEKF